MVIEITEEEEIDREALERKHRALGNQGALALDDWGSGYSNSNSHTNHRVVSCSDQSHHFYVSWY